MDEYTKVYQLHGPMSQADLDWMYSSGIDIHIEAPYEKGDSGWCDMGTGFQIITNSHKFTAFVRDDKQDTWLKLYWDDRATLISNIYTVSYKYDDAT